MRYVKRIGAGLAILVAVLGGLAWYVRGLPWRNRCGDPAPARASLAAAANAAVATSQPLATKAAADTLTAGGSAVDAAIAAALMLSVVEPGNSGLGGGGFALVHDPKTDSDLAFDFRERAPLGLDVAALTAAVRADPNALRNGALAVAVPAEWQGLVALHARFGRLPMSVLARPAIAAARAGVEVGRDYTARCWVRFSSLRKNADARRIFLTRRGGICPMPGWLLRQPELADTLAALTDADHPVAWDQQVGKKMVAFLAQAGNRISARDLQATAVVERPAVTGLFHGKRIVAMGPPSSGGILVIGLLQTYERMRQRLPQANWLHLWTEASRLVFYDRAKLLGDPDFVAVPVERLVSGAYAATQAGRVSETGAIALSDDPPVHEGTHTTHLSVVDKDGLAVALTQTINVPFGAGLVVPGTGVLLNDEMDDFYVEGPNAFGLVGNDRNAPAAGKRPLSSMSPTFVFDDRKLVAVLGSPGGSSIPSAVAWVIREMVEGQRNGEEAVRSPRVHDQWTPNVLQVEPRFDRSSLTPELSARSAKPQFPIGRVQMVVLERGGWRGVSDCRDEGAPWEGAL
jgi:gamma-glutamyltranspeptidase/glutathione hydrolase